MLEIGMRRVEAMRCAWATLIWLFCAVIGSAQTDPGPVDLSTRASARAWFNQWWPLSHNAAMGFTGDVSKGQAGDTSQAFKDNVALRINIFRRMAGLQPIVLNNATYNAKDQQAAMMMSANNDITHNPPTTWKFYSAEGADGCANSLLSLDEAGPTAIVGYMYDWGPFNGTAGHRNQGILLPSVTVLGTGDVPSAGIYSAANAVWANDLSVGDSATNNATPLLPWPAKGYVPNFLIPGRWTLFVPDLSLTAPCDLSGASASVTKDGLALNIKVSPSPSGAALVWTLDGTDEGDSDTQILSFSYQGELLGWARPNFQQDVHYHVIVDGIRVAHLDSTGKNLGDGVLYTGSGVVDGHLEYDVTGYDPDVVLVDPNNQASLINISTRSFAGAGSSTQIAGFIISGSSSRKVLVRAGGPYLTQFGVSNVLADPVLTLFDGQTQIAANDDWSENATEIAAVSTAVGAVSFPQGSKDSGLVITLQPGHPYTAQVTGKNGATGNAIVEVYDADSPSDSHLINISTRSYVGTGASVQIGGFILHGGGPRRVIIRAGGPYLTQFGVKNVLPDPILTVFRGQTQIARNDDWGDNTADITSASAAVNIIPYSIGSKDSALVLTLDPDQPYTAQVSGANGGTGNALIEVFEVP
jgi:hypothetical protein